MSVTPQVYEIGDAVRLLHVKTENTKTTCISLILLTPLCENTAENTVLASFLAHSAKKYPTLARVNEQLEELYGAAFSSDVSKLGEGYRLRLSVTCINDALCLDGEQISADALRLLLDLLFEPLCENGAFDAHQLETEIRLCAQDIESELNDKRAYALSQMVEHMCAEEPYGLSKAELLEGVKSVTPESLYEAWQTLLSTAAISVQVVGDVDFAPLEGMLRTRFGALSRAPRAVETVFVEAAEEFSEYTEEMELNQSKLVLGFRCGMQNADDDFFSMRVMADVFGGGPYSRLFMHVREKLSLCYYCSARLDRRKGIMVVQSGIEAKNKQAALDEILKQLSVMQNGEFTDEELSASKAALCDAYRGVNDTPESVDAYYAQFVDTKPQTPEEIAEGIGAVDRAAVVAAAKRLTLDTVYFLKGGEENA